MRIVGPIQFWTGCVIYLNFLFFFILRKNMQPLKKDLKICLKKTTQLLQNCIGPTIRIGQEIQCDQYEGFFLNMTGFGLNISKQLIR